MVAAVHSQGPTATNGQGTKRSKFFLTAIDESDLSEMWLSNREQSTLLEAIGATAVFVSNMFPYYRR